MPATVDSALWGVPAARHEAACASGSIAALAAMADLRSGAYDVALVVGLELEKTVPGDVGRPIWPRPGGPGTTTPAPRTCGRTPSPGWPTSTTAATASTTRICARSPRSTTPTPVAIPMRRPAIGKFPTSPPTETTTRSSRASTVSCAATTAVSSPTEGRPGAGLRPLPARSPRRPADRAHRRLGHRTVGLGLKQKLDRDADSPYVMPHVRDAVHDAFRRAEVTLDGVDGFEVHDCFTPSEYLAIDHIGLTGPGNRGRPSRTARSRSTAGCR